MRTVPVNPLATVTPKKLVLVLQDKWGDAVHRILLGNFDEDLIAIEAAREWFDVSTQVEFINDFEQLILPRTAANQVALNLVFAQQCYILGQQDAPLCVTQLNERMIVEASGIERINADHSQPAS